MGVSDAALAMDEALKDNLGMTERGDLLLKYQGGGVGGRVIVISLEITPPPPPPPYPPPFVSGCWRILMWVDESRGWWFI